MELSVLGILWFFLIFLLIGGYFVLDGFDLGVGTLYPFICKDEREQAVARRSIGPVWDGNEVWLLTAGGALFAAFPDAYATTFSGFYLAMMLVLFSLIVRAVCFEFWAADSKWRKVWDWCFFLGSALPALLLGVALGNVIYGIPMDAYGNYIGLPLIGLLNPFTLLCGLLGLSMFIAAGASWLALKAPKDSDVRERALKVKPVSQWAAIILFICTTICLAAVRGSLDPNTIAMIPACYILAAGFVALVIVSVFASRLGRGMAGAQDGAASRSDLIAFVLQSGASIFLVFLVACSMFPFLVMASNSGMGGDISIATAGASNLSLTYMTVILCIGLPFVLAYHVIIYRTFRGRVSAMEAE